MKWIRGQTARQHSRHSEDGTGTQANNEGSARGGGGRDRTVAESRGNNEIQGATEASRGRERGISTRDRM